MDLLEDRRLAAPQIGVDETAARREMRLQIERLERQLSEALVAAFPHAAVDVAIGGLSGPRVLPLGDLERQRDALQARLRHVRGTLETRAAQVEANRVLLEKMLLEPERHKFA